MPLPNIVKERIEYVASYVQGSLTDWYLIKTEILHQMPGHLRGWVGFTKRHRSTKKMLMNDVEREAMALWELLTGIKPILDPARTHDPGWVYRRRGWALNGGKEKLLQEEAARKTSSDHHGDDR
jgi:hypothetical protein